MNTTTTTVISPNKGKTEFCMDFLTWPLAYPIPNTMQNIHILALYTTTTEHTIGFQRAGYTLNHLLNP